MAQQDKIPRGCAGIIILFLLLFTAVTWIGSGSSTPQKTDAACRADLRCLGDKVSFEATSACKPRIEHLAANDFQWIDGTFESKFSSFRWKNPSAHQVTFIGDRIKFENGFGAWIRMKYQCDYDADTNQVLDVRMSQGQIE